jgi:asparagine synthase (glutamine-hydrolysing)
MCGIAGFLKFGEDHCSDQRLINRMLSQIKHRGPDHGGSFLSENIVLGNRRLKIIDLDGGNQPIFNENKTIAVVFNGEIYNFKSLRGVLVKRGHRFRTKTDTEVIVHSYEEWGMNFLKRLDGMFSLALWDGNCKRLVLARDRFGKKPLHVAKTNRELIFGSEIKSLLVHPRVPKEIDQIALEKFLTYGYVPAPDSIFKSIKKLLPASYLICDASGRIKSGFYWKIDFRTNRNLEEETIINEIDNKLTKAVEKRLVSDVPLGAFLIGGIDSSLVVAMMSKFMPSSKIKTFNIGFKESKFNESNYAERIAAQYNTDHQAKLFTSEDFVRVVEEITDFIDEPIADPSLIPTFLVSKFSSQFITVALTGDGGDEMFGGYPKYNIHRLSQFLILPQLLNKAMLSLIRVVPKSSDSRLFNYKMERFIAGLKYPVKYRNQVWIAPFTPDESELILGRKIFLENVFDNVERHLSQFKAEGSGVFEMANYLDFKLTLQDLYLVKVDRASMASSIETRSPFLDKDLAQLAFSIPSNLKVKGFKTKSILKKLAERYLPKDVIYRPKTGFGIPLDWWTRQRRMKKEITYFLNKKHVKKQGIFNPIFVNQLLVEHYEKNRDLSSQIWAMYIFQKWYTKWIRN